VKLNSIEREIHSFLLEEALAAKNIRSLDLDDSLFASGAMDSAVVMQLVVFCEENFGIEIPDSEVVPENFATLRALARLVQRSKKT